ncbi:hypothetical protein BJY21_004364 [Kineosphaera limosa]|uniref:DUF3037 domain-containing protein n=1 Tax=Kineosphaera limosa NBRC 100340 TaxID=1184609 RepID=K6WQY3_9MICO|nr:DUF3037 domain-containing protein [Kineosphaera limosa]NYE03180.1 hypothetical protein [Kineosphaera limosa]GAB94517.1 hypothetical protein KILIM_005_01340 [Kineosphaera limosa NBRC 100340]
MSEQPIPYQYFLLRAVPRPEREEFLNVGVVLYAEDLDALAVAWHVDADRLRALDPRLDLDALRLALDHLQATATGGGSAGMARARRRGALFGWLAAPRSTLVQPGPVHGGVCLRTPHGSGAGDPESDHDVDPLTATLAHLMTRHVLLP